MLTWVLPTIERLGSLSDMPCSKEYLVTNCYRVNIVMVQIQQLILCVLKGSIVLLGPNMQINILAQLAHTTPLKEREL